MASITIHSIDDSLKARLDQEAKRRGTSKNQLVKELLSDDLGVRSDSAAENGYSEFCGVWGSEDLEEFAATQRENETSDRSDWR
ncbi:MAG: FitA-like ribbon-helix-helix domain-containing protein [bacterium]